MASVTPFGNSNLWDELLHSPCQIILSTNKEYYYIANFNNSNVIQTNLTGTEASVLFTLDTSIYPFDNNHNLCGICYNPDNTKFILAITGDATTYNYIVQVDLDGTNPSVLMDNSYTISGTSIPALREVQCISLTADKNYYLITMYALYPDGNNYIISVPVNNMTSPTIFLNSATVPGGLSTFPLGDEAICYSLDRSHFLFTNYDNNTIYQMNLDGTNISPLYTKSTILGGNSLDGLEGLIPTADNSGYILISCNNNKIFKLTLPAPPCFLEGTRILCKLNMNDSKDYYVPIEQLRKGTLVKTSRDGYKKIVYIGKKNIENSDNDERTENRLYKLTPANYPKLKEDLYITGHHSVLVDSLTEEQKEETIKYVGYVYSTDGKARLMARVDDRAIPWQSAGSYTIWHFALETTDVYKNFGVYANGGLLVETCCIKLLRDESNMTLL